MAIQNAELFVESPHGSVSQKAVCGKSQPQRQNREVAEVFNFLSLLLLLAAMG